ncbi:tetratricopeptide repeat protein [Streptomyces sp. NPDC057433]|uniref:tetratricopeptide repeat protein n=1 Tax=Streptomyces sp. NPDC057433 TaxID=3346132 RepID=UPI0036BCD0BB
MPPRTNDHAPESGRDPGPTGLTGLTGATEPTAPPDAGPARPGTGGESDTSPENQADTEAGAKAEADTEAWAEADTEAWAEADTEAWAEADTRARAEADTDTDTRAGADTDTEAGADTDTEAGADTDTDTEAGADTRADTEAGADTRADTEAGADTRADTGAAEPAVRTFSPGVRVAALRRFSAAVRRSRGAHLTVCAALLAVAMTAGAVAVGSGRDGARAGADAAPAAGTLAAGVLAGGDLDAGIRALQSHLRSQPRDFAGWAGLGLAYVEQARTKGDPSRYPQADRAFDRSLGLEPGNEPALAGRAALAAARHDFSGALEYADRALRQNPYSERALSSRIDALVELGRYDEASDAADTADSRRPGVPVFTRYAYVRELRGDVRTAREVLERALNGASAPTDVAYVATALGQLAWNQGDYETALTHFARALAADEEYLPALEGRARAQAASGDRAGAIGTLERVVARSPLPGPLVALGELYEARGADGDRTKAADQYALVDAQASLARAGGVNADLDTALAAADHGDPEAALRAARAEWARRHSVHTADALAWALHRSGRSEEALPYALRATATGYRNAAFLHHRGMIERATGHDADARRSLTAALELNPGFSPLGARAARAALEDLEAAR